MPLDRTPIEGEAPGKMRAPLYPTSRTDEYGDRVYRVEAHPFQLRGMRYVPRRKRHATLDEIKEQGWTRTDPSPVSRQTQGVN